jgi:hypothetical protein
MTKIVEKPTFLKNAGTFLKNAGRSLIKWRKMLSNIKKIATFCKMLTKKVDETNISLKC